MSVRDVVRDMVYVYRERLKSNSEQVQLTAPTHRPTQLWQ